MSTSSSLPHIPLPPISPFHPLYTQTSSSDVEDTTDSDDSSLVGLYALPLTALFTIAVYAWEAYLDCRQRSAYKRTAFPVELERVVGRLDEEEASREDDDDKKEEKENAKKKDAAADDADDDDDDDDKTKSRMDVHKPLLPQLRRRFDAAQSYGLDKIHFSMASNAFDVLESLVLLYVGYAPFVWDMSNRLGNNVLGWDERTDEIKITMIYLLIVTIVSSVISLPFEVYKTFHIEKKHGFSKITPKLFVTDKIKSLLLTFAIGGPFVALLLKIINWGGQYFYIYVWAFVFLFSVAMMTIVPVYIMPLFNKYEALPDGPLKKDIYSLAEQLNYPLTKLYVVDGSKRSSHSNAYMYGFGNNKRIVLFDTLLEGDGKVRDDEVVAILGHELGHWKLRHTALNFVVSQLYFAAAFYAFSLSYGSYELCGAFGFNGYRIGRPTPTIVALSIFFQTLWAPVDKVLSFALTCQSRRFEFQADAFSSRLGMGGRLQSGLTKIHLENLGAMATDPWFSAYHYSHPPLVERLAAMMELDKKSK